MVPAVGELSSDSQTMSIRGKLYDASSPHMCALSVRCMPILEVRLTVIILENCRPKTRTDRA